MTKFEDMKVGQKYKYKTDTREILFKTDQTIFVRNLTQQGHPESSWNKNSESFVSWELVKPTKVLWVIPFYTVYSTNIRTASYETEEEALYKVRNRFNTNGKNAFPWIGNPIKIEFEVEE